MNNVTRLMIRPKNLMLFIIMLFSIFPSVHVASFQMPVLYFLLPVGVLIFLLIILGRIRIPKILKYIILINLLILIEVFLSTLNGTIIAFNRFIFPTDLIQYIARFLFLISFTALSYRRNIEAETFIKYFLIISAIGMLIGILQWIPWPGRVLLIKLYPFRDGTEQLAQLNRPLHLLRLHGIAQFATANGGLATFFFTFGYSIFRYYEKYKFLSVLLMALSIINIFASQARAGILSLVVSVLLLYIIDIRIYKKSIKTVLCASLVILILFLTVQVLYNMGDPFVNRMVYRWKALIDTRGGARINQAIYFISKLETIGDYLFGFSKQVINKSAYSFGVEIEPVNIFITYGALGFILQYTLVIMLLVYFIRNIKKSIHDKTSLTLMVASFVGLFSYQVFSIAYYFFREIRVGLFPWILMGVTIGVYERKRGSL